MIEGPMAVGNADLTVLKTGHSREDWELYKDIIIQEIPHHDEIIMEYNPKEHKIKSLPFRLLNSRIDILNSTDNYLFIPVADICEKLKKNVHVFDPAYNEAFILLHVLLFGASILPPVAVVIRMARELYIHRDDLITRRTAIKGGITAVCTMTAALLGTGAVVGPNRVLGPSPALGDLQNEFRRVVTAQHIVDFGAGLPERRKVLMMYTKEHGDGIIYNIKNEEQRQQTLAKYLWLGNFSFFRQLFEARHYPQGIVPAAGPSERTLLSSLAS